MSTPEVISTNARSDGAKKMWERRRKDKEERKEIQVKQPASDRNWIYHAEWFTLMAAVLGCFLFVHGEAVHTNDRLDSHIEQINKRVDDSNNQLNKRCDELHREFYELLKEMRK